MKKSRLLSLFLAMVMVFGVVSALGATAMAAEKPKMPHGYWDGTKIWWETVDDADYYYLVIGERLSSGELVRRIDVEFRVNGNVADMFYVNSHQDNNFNVNGIITVNNGKITVDLEKWYKQTGVMNMAVIRENVLDFELQSIIYDHSSTYSNKFQSESVEGSDLLNGYKSPIDITVSGSVTISPSNPKYGDIIRFTLGGSAASIPSDQIMFVWQESDDSVDWYDVQAYSKEYTVGADDFGKYIRVKVSASAEGYTGILISDPINVPQSVVPNPTLTGTVKIYPENPKPGDTVGLWSYDGELIGQKLNWQWQVNTGSGFSNIPGATSFLEYTIPMDARSGSTYRLSVTADGYSGTVYSNVLTVTGGSSYQKGDVNMDKTLDNADLILVARYVVNLYNFSSEAFKLGDMDNSGVIDNSDLIRLARLLVGLS